MAAPGESTSRSGESTSPQEQFRGERLGLPQAGPGSIASQLRRLAGFVVDLAASGLVGSLVVLPFGHVSATTRNLVETAAFLLEVLVLTTLTGQSVGMRVCRERLLWRDGGRPPLRWALLRLVLFCLPVPGILAVLVDQDLRGLHDRAAGTVLVNA